jgi:hypothetical protein
MDDGVRGSFGVTVSAMDVGRNKVRLSFDDVDHLTGHAGHRWKHYCFYTSVELDRDLFDRAELSEAECATLGRALLIALSARLDISRRKRKDD